MSLLVQFFNDTTLTYITSLSLIFKNKLKSYKLQIHHFESTSDILFSLFVREVTREQEFFTH